MEVFFKDDKVLFSDDGFVAMSMDCCCGTGACCYHDEPCDDTIDQTTCEGGGGTWYDGVNCTDSNPCGDACCIQVQTYPNCTDGPDWCTVSPGSKCVGVPDAGACDMLGGVFSGPGITCDTISEGQPNPCCNLCLNAFSPVICEDDSGTCYSQVSCTNDPFPAGCDDPVACTGVLALNFDTYTCCDGDCNCVAATPIPNELIDPVTCEHTFIPVICPSAHSAYNHFYNFISCP